MQQGPCPYEHSATLRLDGDDMEYDIILTQLEEFSTYTVNVSAGNAAGYSTATTGQVTTWQAGNHFQIIKLIYISMAIAISNVRLFLCLASAVCARDVVVGLRGALVVLLLFPVVHRFFQSKHYSDGCLFGSDVWKTVNFWSDAVSSFGVNCEEVSIWPTVSA